MAALAKHVLLDFGSVISKSLFEDVAAIELAFGLRPGTLPWHGPLDLARDRLWRDMLAGLLSERDYWRRRAEELGEQLGIPDLTIAEIIRRSRADDPDSCVRPEAASLVRAAHAAGRRVGVLSNELVMFYGEAIVRRLSILADIDTVIDATYTMILKPDPRAYRMACVALDAAPEDILFIDDQPRNIAGAEACGLRTIRLDITDAAAAFARARAMLGLPEE